MWKFKWCKGKDKWIVLFCMGMILCILSFPLGTDQTEASGVSVAAASSTVGEELKVQEAAVSLVSGRDGYEKELEERVKELLKAVDGVGKVDVMIVLKSSAEKVIYKDSNVSRSTTEEKDTSGGVRKIETSSMEDTAVLSGGSSQGEPIVEKELFPEVSGVVISASGGGSPKVQAEIVAAMQALFDLPAHKIKVLKRTE